MFASGMSDIRMDDAIKHVKSSLTLDFSSMKKSTFEDVLSSPDLGLLKLATPDLDRFILQHHQERNNGEVLTPTQIYFPNSVTEEQEAYARGFVDALLDLQCKQEVSAGGLSTANKSSDLSNNHPHPSDSFFNPSSLMLHDARMKAENAAFNVEMPAVICRNDMNYSASHSVAREQHKMPFSERQVSAVTAKHAHNNNNNYYYKPPIECQTTDLKTKNDRKTAALPFIGLMGVDTPPISPIDMVQQEAIKLQRKRARNRLAATRCRNRKLERIAILQGRVNELKAENSRLAHTAASLRQIVGQMKREVMEHANSGCRLLTHHSLFM